MQAGLLLTASTHQVTELAVPQPAEDRNHIEPRAYSSLLPDADPQHLLLAAVPFSELVGRRVLLVYDASGRGEPNAIATRLTTNVQDGLEVQVHGDALALYAEPGADLRQADWQQLDNVIYGELTEYFAEGKKPTPEEVERLVEGFKSGQYDYSKRHEGEEGEDVNKDDAGEDLQDALQDA